jgi:hypothetical protein
VKFGIVNAAESKAEIVDLPDVQDAILAAGLKRGEVDFGSVSRHLAFIVFEYGLFTPPEEQSYFGMAGRLVAGNAVLFGVDDAGETVDLEQLPPIRFFGRGREEAEMAIAMGVVARPQTAINGVVLWQWPDPQPADL